MYELLALFSRLPAAVDMASEAYSRHGGLGGPPKYSRGIACYESLDVRASPRASNRYSFLVTSR